MGEGGTYYLLSYCCPGGGLRKVGGREGRGETPRGVHLYSQYLDRYCTIANCSLCLCTLQACFLPSAGQDWAVLASRMIGKRQVWGM